MLEPNEAAGFLLRSGTGLPTLSLIRLPFRLQVLHANLAAMGAAKALPYLLMFAASNAGGEWCLPPLPARLLLKWPLRKQLAASGAAVCSGIRGAACDATATGQHGVSEPDLTGWLRACTTLSVGWAGDWLINSGRCSVAAGRKIVNTAGFWSAAAALMLMPGANRAPQGLPPRCRACSLQMHRVPNHLIPLRGHLACCLTPAVLEPCPPSPLSLPPCSGTLHGCGAALHLTVPGMRRLLSRRLLSQPHGHRPQVCWRGHVSWRHGAVEGW